MNDSPTQHTSHEPADSTEPTAVSLPHTAAEDILGVLTGTWLASLGLHLLHEAHAVTGGTRVCRCWSRTRPHCRFR
jgi:hypothetical protein